MLSHCESDGASFLVMFIIKAALNFQHSPSVCLNSCLGFVAVHHRTLGILTGSRCAVVLGQIPILDFCKREEPFLQAHSWASCAHCSLILSWVKFIDNKVAVGARIESSLASRCKLELKPDSKSLQTGLGCDEQCAWVSVWHTAAIA